MLDSLLLAQEGFLGKKSFLEKVVIKTIKDVKNDLKKQQKEIEARNKKLEKEYLKNEKQRLKI